MSQNLLVEVLIPDCVLSCNFRYGNILIVFQTVLKDEGWGVLMRGYMPTVMGSCVYAGISFYTYETLKIMHAGWYGLFFVYSSVCLYEKVSSFYTFRLMLFDVVGFTEYVCLSVLISVLWHVQYIRLDCLLRQF